MTDESILDEMDLPLANTNEDLETISKNRFYPLLDVTKFEIRSEDLRDKGIDLHIELKKANKYTNFRFVVQLKATDSKLANKDGSISLQIHTSNINYLLNNPMPAYYVLYLKNTDTFYYENLNLFVKELANDTPEWHTQGTHTLRFKKTLTKEAIIQIYDETLKKGKFHRKVNERLILKSASLFPTDKISLDAELNVSSDNEIRNQIENIGFVLINEGKWKDVIMVHKKGSGNIAITAKYNLVLGVASYYSGNLLDALSFFKSSFKLKFELSPELESHLAYFYASTKNSLGLISEEDYKKQMNLLEDSANVGLYIKLEKSKENYFKSLSKDSVDKFEKLIAEINDIINDPNADDGIRLNAKCELILLEGSKNNWDYVKGIAAINAIEAITGPDQQLRLESAKKFIASNSLWFKSLQSVKEIALNNKNYFHYFNALLNEVKITYERQVFLKYVSIEQQIPGYPVPEMPDVKPIFTDILNKVEQALKYYRQVGHIENEVVALSAKYELQHYLNDFHDADITFREAETLIESYELTDKKRRLDYLKDEGTTHQRFKAWIDGIFEEGKKKREEYEAMIADMKDMDDDERETKLKMNNRLCIHLFPIGYFTFPKLNISDVYDILNIKSSDAKKSFDGVFSIAVPIANIFYDEIIQEGPLDGKHADKGIESWRNIYRIRKAFYQKKFYRKELP